MHRTQYGSQNELLYNPTRLLCKTWYEHENFEDDVKFVRVKTVAIPKTFHIVLLLHVYRFLFVFRLRIMPLRWESRSYKLLKILRDIYSRLNKTIMYSYRL